MAEPDTRYYLRGGHDDDGPWREVTKEDYVRAERAAGFNNTMGLRAEPDTSAFGAYSVSGRTERAPR